MKRKRIVVLVIALVVLCVLIGLGIALWYLFGSNPNDGGGNGDDTITVTPGDPDDEPETPGNPDDEPGTPGNPDDEPGTPGNSDDEPGMPGDPDDEPDMPHEHTYTSEVTREPLCDQVGEMTYTCTCGDSYTEPIAMIAHSVVIDEAVAPTCTATGLTEGKHCSVCGTVLVEQEVVSMVAHNYVDGVCTECGEPEPQPPTAGLVFCLSADGMQYSVTDYTGTATEVYIPATYNGLPVTSIGDEAFQFCSNLTGITIPNSVTSIGKSAFSVCSSLTSIKLPDSVTMIGEAAFSVCSSLTSITIPKGVTSIGERAYDSCSSLENIAVASSNSVYHSAENCIIETESKTLILGCKNSVIPTGGSVTSIGNWAFLGCSGLTSIEIPDSVTSIGGGAFYACERLEGIALPGSVTSIGSHAFA